eukprot:1857565-Rhodomonas_salina.2
MDEQIHKSSLMTSAASRRLAEDIEDPIWEEMKMEIIADSVGSHIPPSLLTPVMECRFLPPFRPHIFSLLPVSADNMTFRLHLRADSRLQSGWQEWRPRAAPAVLAQRTEETEQDTTLDCNEIEPIPDYAYDELEEWTSHLQISARRNIHWVCLQSPSLAETLKKEHSLHPRDSSSDVESENCDETDLNAASDDVECAAECAAAGAAEAAAVASACEQPTREISRGNDETTAQWSDIVVCLAQTSTISWLGKRMMVAGTEVTVCGFARHSVPPGLVAAEALPLLIQFSP